MNISEISIKRPVGTLVIASLIAIFGLFFLKTLSIDLLPNITYPLVRIMIDWKGAGPEDIEKNIIEKIEAVIGTTEDATKVFSTARDGNATIEVYFEYGKNMDVALADTKNKLDLARKELPFDIEEPRISKADPGALPILDIAFFSDKKTELYLREWADNELSKLFLGIPGLGAISVNGGKEREIKIYFDQKKLAQFELAQDTIINTLAKENLNFPAGKIDDNEHEFIVRILSKYKNMEEIENTIIANRFGRFIRVKDIGDVVDLYSEQQVLTRFNGKPAVTLSFYKQPNANTIKIVNSIVSKLKYIKDNKLIPTDVEYGIVSSQSQYILNAINNVSSSALIGAILAILVILIFLQSIRRTIIIALAVPLSILGTFIIMRFFNVTLNLFSLGGLVVAVGMLLDGSIVMLENITRHHHQNGSYFKAGVDASKEVFAPLLASLLTNVAVLIPIFFIEGLTSLLFRDIVITVMAAFLISFLVSITLVPCLTVLLFKKDDLKPLRSSDFNKKTLFNQFIESLTSAYGFLLKKALRRKGGLLIIAMTLFAGSLYLGSQLGSEFLPKIDDGKASVKIILPIGTSLGNTKEIALQVEKIIQNMPGVSNVYSMVGGYLKKKNIYIKSNEANINIELVKKSDRPITTAQFTKKLQRTLNELKIKNVKMKVIKSKIRGIRSVSETDVDVRIKGFDLKILEGIAKDIYAKIKSVPGIVNADISIDFKRPEVHINFFKEKINDLGLNVSQITSYVKSAVDGIVATEYTDQALNIDYDIRVMLEPKKIQSIKDIGNIELPTISGSKIKLKEVASINLSKGPIQVDREDQVRIVSVIADVSGKNIGKVTTEIKKLLNDYNLPAGYRIDFGGEEQASRESSSKLLVVIVLAIILVYAVMAVQYESFKDPLIIMVTLPLALIGAFSLMYISKTPMGTTAFLGLILLVGIVVNNAIVLVEFINENYKNKKMTLNDAIVTAGKLRLRPILMTTLTTTSGLLPLVLSWGEGLEMLKPLAIAVSGGLIVGAFLTLFIIPIIYTYAYNKQEI